MAAVAGIRGFREALQVRWCARVQASGRLRWRASLGILVWGWAELALFTAINSLPLTASHRIPLFASLAGCSHRATRSISLAHSLLAVPRLLRSPRVLLIDPPAPDTALRNNLGDTFSGLLRRAGLWLAGWLPGWEPR